MLSLRTSKYEWYRTGDGAVMKACIHTATAPIWMLWQLWAPAGHHKCWNIINIIINGVTSSEASLRLSKFLVAPEERASHHSLAAQKPHVPHHSQEQLRLPYTTSHHRGAKGMSILDTWEDTDTHIESKHFNLIVTAQHSHVVSSAPLLAQQSG